MTFKIRIKEEGLNYLGIPIFSRKPKRNMFRPILEYIDGKLSNWRCIHLALPARISLIKSVLLAKPSYWFRSIRFPEFVLNMIDKKIKSFLWGGDKSIRWVPWAKVCTTIKAGGMGLSSAKSLNMAFLAKHVAALDEVDGMKDINYQWLNITKHKYHTQNGLKAGSSASWTWKMLVKMHRDNYLSIRWKVGDGKSVRLWLDPWLREKPLWLYPWTINMDTARVGLMVSELMKGTGEWDESKICEFIPGSLSGEILNLHRGERDVKTTIF